MDLTTRALLVVTVVVAGWFSHAQAFIICDKTASAICFSCTSVGECAGPGQVATETTVCMNGQVCELVGGEGKCVDPPGTACECTPFSLGCDKYDPQAVIFCGNGGVPGGAIAPNLAQQCQTTQKCSAGKCVEDTVTTKPDTCTSANENKRYPHDTECNKYYTCREVRTGTYMYVLSTCPSSLLYDRENGYCDLKSKVTC